MVGRVVPVVSGLGLDVGVAWVWLRLRGFPGLCSGWMARHGQRRALGELDARLLADIGVGRGEAAREAGVPFWR